MARSVGATGAGSCVSPSGYRSTAAAQARPSAIAQTMSDWPRPASPATKTPVGAGHVVAVACHVAAVVELARTCSVMPAGSGPVKPSARKHQVRGDLPLGAGLRHAAAVDVLGLGHPDARAPRRLRRGTRRWRRGTRARRPPRARWPPRTGSGCVGHGWCAGALGRRLLADGEVGDRGAPLAVRGADAVRAGVAAAEDDDVLALGA